MRKLPAENFMEWVKEHLANSFLYLVSNELITEFKIKAKIVNKYFASQFVMIGNNSTLPSTLNFLTD